MEVVEEYQLRNVRHYPQYDWKLGSEGMLPHMLGERRNSLLLVEQAFLQAAARYLASGSNPPETYSALALKS